MKLKYIAIIALSSISINALALSGNGYRVISEKTYSTPGFNAQFVSLDKKKILFPESHHINVSAEDANGKINQYITIKGHHYVSYTNETNKNVYITYTYRLDCLAQHAYYERSIQVMSSGSFTDDSMSFGAIINGHTGSYEISAETILVGAEIDKREASGTIDITK